MTSPLFISSVCCITLTCCLCFWKCLSEAEWVTHCRQNLPVVVNNVTRTQQHWALFPSWLVVWLFQYLVTDQRSYSNHPKRTVTCSSRLDQKPHLLFTSPVCRSCFQIYSLGSSWILKSVSKYSPLLTTMIQSEDLLGLRKQKWLTAHNL